MTYDCFPLFNELDLLEIRLNVLNDVVDRFVFVEATKTFSGKDKPLYYEENKERFSRFAHKITHIVVDDYPPFETAWTYENHQRNCLMRGLADIQPDDIIMTSDLDEIPDPAMVEKYKTTAGVKLFAPKMYCYYLNYHNYSWPFSGLGTNMLSYRDFLSLSDQHVKDATIFQYAPRNEGPTLTKVRFYKKVVIVRNAGWHFSYLGGIDAIIYKIKSYAHQEFNNDEYCNPERLQQRMQSGEYVVGGGVGRRVRHFGVEIDASFPRYLVEHQRDYPHLIFPVTDAYLEKTKWARRYFFIKGRIYSRLRPRFFPKWVRSLVLALLGKNVTM